MPSLTAQLSQIYDFGSVIASPARRICATDFLDKVIIAHPDAPLLYWKGSGSCLRVPGLPLTEYYRGVKSFQGSLFVWRNNVLKWSSQNDFSEWIPVGETATSYVFTLVAAYTKGAVGVESDYIYVDKAASGLAAGQFLRIDSDPYYSFFEAVRTLPNVGLIGSVSGFSQSVAPLETKDIFISAFIPYVQGARLYFDGGLATMEVQRNAQAPTAVSLTLENDFVVPAAGDLVVATVTSQPTISAGAYVSVGPSFFTGQDIYYVEAVDIIAGTLSLRRMGVGLSSPTIHSAGEFIVGQPSVNVKNLDAALSATGSFLTRLKERYGFTVKPLDLSSAAPAATVFAAGAEVFTVDANAAGETVNAGSSVNGPILHFDTLGDYGFIFKRRSIQSVQYVGPDQGTIFIRPEVTDEGLFGDYSFVKVGLDLMYFWGNREIYRYGGGNQLTPVGQRFTKQVFEEVDRSRANEIFGYHNEKNSEIWFVYPRTGVSGALRVFIYNYLEDSCSVDDYATALTAAGRLDWSNDVIWSSSTGSWVAPTSWAASASWDDLGADTNDVKTILGTAAPSLINHGEDYTRLGAAFLSETETMDFDAGDPLAWKYVDTVVVSLQVKAVLAGVKLLSVYVGTKKDFDDTVTWSSPQTVEVQGDGNYTTKVNIQKSGKFIRLKIASQVADIQWRISEIKILGRMGGTY